MSKARTALLVITLLLSSNVMAEVTNGKFPLCFTFSDLNEIWSGLSKQDDMQVQSLVKQERCFYLKAGIKLSVIKRIGVVYKVRVYVGESSLEMYTSDQGYE